MNTFYLVLIAVVGALTTITAFANTVLSFVNNQRLAKQGIKLDQQEKKTQEIHVMVNERLDGALKLAQGLQADMADVNKRTTEAITVMAALAHHGSDVTDAITALAAIKRVSAAPVPVKPPEALTDSGSAAIRTLIAAEPPLPVDAGATNVENTPTPETP